MAVRMERVRKEAERLEALADIADVVKDLAKLLEKMVRTSWAVVYLFHKHRDLTPAQSYKLPRNYRKALLTPPFLTESLPHLKSLLRGREHLNIPDTAATELPPELQQLFAPLSLLIVPMVVRNQVTGAVIMGRKKEEPFADKEIAVIRDIVDHAAVVVSHMLLFDESLDMAVDLGKRIDIILTIDDINRAISSSLSRNRIMETALDHIERIVGCELVMALEQQQEVFQVIGHRERGIILPDPAPEAEKAGNATLNHTLLAKGKSCNIASLKRLRKTGPLDNALIAAGISSIIAVPLMSQGKLKGVLLLGSKQTGRFKEEETFTVEKIAAQMAVALENARLYEDMRSLFFNTVASLANAIDAKSPWTKGHSQRVMHMAGSLAKLLNLPPETVEKVKIGGLLHDIGKIGIIEALLEKPATLSEDEFPPMRLHPEIGVSILEPIEQLRDVLPGILHHHEWYNGTGYPKKLKGDEIPLEARIISVADSFDAMVADRPYKKGYSVKDAVAELRNCAGTQFDPTIVAIFTKDIEKKWAAMAHQ